MTSAVIALGTFDGMHPGHTAVIDRAVSEAKLRQMDSVVYTFSNNPRAVFASAPRQLMSPDEKERALYARGVDRVVSVPFTPETAATPPRAFADMLAREFGMKVAVVGADYTFGAKAAGNAEMLSEYGREMGFSVIVVPLVMRDGEKISSTRLREQLPGPQITKGESE